MFSLRDTLVALDDDGVAFRSVYDGSVERFTPERVAAIQERLGSDIAMCLDICPPANVSRAEHEQAVRFVAQLTQREEGQALVERVRRMIARNEYKRRQAPPILRVRARAFGTGRQMPIAAKHY